MEIADLRSMPEGELLDRIQKLRKEVFHLRFKAVTEPVTDPAGLRSKRKEIARIRTVLREKELVGESGAAASRRAQKGLSRDGRKLKARGQERWAERRRKQAARRGRAPVAKAPKAQLAASGTTQGGEQ